MKNTQSPTLLLALLTAAALLALALCGLYIRDARELRTAQGQMQIQASAIQNNRNFLGSLAGDLLEYSKTHKDIDTVLTKAGIKQGSSATAATGAQTTTSKPAAK